MCFPVILQSASDFVFLLIISDNHTMIVNNDIERRTLIVCTVSVWAGLDTLTLLGITSDTGIVPVMATSRDLIAGQLIKGAFVDLRFDTNPLDDDCDTRIGVQVQPVEVKYDAVGSVWVVCFFELSVSQLF